MRYLIFETLEAAKTRSASQAVNMGFQKNCTTKYWWSWRETADGTWALLIPKSAISWLSEIEQSELVDEPQWPVVDGV
jgi:hypothetical protein